MAHGTRRNETDKVHNTDSYPAYSKAVISSKLFIHVCLPLAVRLRLQYVDKEKQEHGIEPSAVYMIHNLVHVGLMYRKTPENVQRGLFSPLGFSSARLLFLP